MSPELLAESKIRIITTELSTPPTKPAITTGPFTTLVITGSRRVIPYIASPDMTPILSTPRFRLTGSANTARGV